MEGDSGNYGVDYSPKFGAECPRCGFYNKTHRHTKVMPWQWDIRFRYHCCKVCGTTFKSVEIDMTQKATFAELRQTRLPGVNGGRT